MSDLELGLSRSLKAYFEPHVATDKGYKLDSWVEFNYSIHQNFGMVLFHRPFHVLLVFLFSRVVS